MTSDSWRFGLRTQITLVASTYIKSPTHRISHEINLFKRLTILLYRFRLDRDPRPPYTFTSRFPCMHRPPLHNDIAGFDHLSLLRTIFLRRDECDRAFQDDDVVHRQGSMHFGKLVRADLSDLTIYAVFEISIEDARGGVVDLVGVDSVLVDGRYANRGEKRRDIGGASKYGIERDVVVMHMDVGAVGVVGSVGGDDTTECGQGGHFERYLVVRPNVLGGLDACLIASLHLYEQAVTYHGHGPGVDSNVPGIDSLLNKSGGKIF